MNVIPENKYKGKVKREILDRIGPIGKSKEGVSGSSGFYLKFINEPYDSLLDAKGNLELHERGLLLYLNKLNRVSIIPISPEEINNICITGGKEDINLIPMSPMFIAENLGITTRVSRYLNTYKFLEYTVTLITLVITWNNGSKIDLHTTGYNNYNLIDFLSSSELFIDKRVHNTT